MPLIDDGKICPKCGQNLSNPKWSPDKPKKITLSCGTCGYWETIDSLDKD
jgi:hypothetical protein